MTANNEAVLELPDGRQVRVVARGGQLEYQAGEGWENETQAEAAD